MGRNAIDITGMVVGRLEAIRRVEDIVCKGDKHYHQWECRCTECGRFSLHRKTRFLHNRDDCPYCKKADSNEEIRINKGTYRLIEELTLDEVLLTPNRSTNTSGYKGIYKRGGNGKYQVEVYVTPRLNETRKISCGSYYNVEDAILAKKTANAILLKLLSNDTIDYFSNSEITKMIKIKMKDFTK